MKYAITVIGEHISPRSTTAEGILVVAIHKENLVNTERVAHNICNAVDLLNCLGENHIDTLVCGGNDKETGEILKAAHISVIDNVAGRLSDTVEALKRGGLVPGYGLLRDYGNKVEKPAGAGKNRRNRKKHGNIKPVVEEDCLGCGRRICLEGKVCAMSLDPPRIQASIHQMLESAIDINYETERVLCRVAELVYFLLEMKYERIGLAYCVDLHEQTGVLADVLGKFFKVYSVCCKIHSTGADKRLDALGADAFDEGTVPCNPLAQAEALGRMGTQFNVMLGLCIGCDSIFAQTSRAPVTTLFVKDKMLANNPIGAIYSEYYLSEISNKCRKKE